MLAGKARLVKVHRAVELIISSPDLSAHKRTGRGVRNFDSAAWDREKQMPCYVANTINSCKTPP